MFAVFNQSNIDIITTNSNIALQSINKLHNIFFSFTFESELKLPKMAPKKKVTEVEEASCICEFIYPPCFLSIQNKSFIRTIIFSTSVIPKGILFLIQIVELYNTDLDITAC